MVPLILGNPHIRVLLVILLVFAGSDTPPLHIHIQRLQLPISCYMGFGVQGIKSLYKSQETSLCVVAHALFHLILHYLSRNLGPDI